MDMTNIKEGNGFITAGDMLIRMHRFRPPTNDYYRLMRMKNGLFSQVGVMAYGSQMMPLFKIYTGNKELYEYIRDMFLKVAAQLGYKAKADEWKDTDAQHALSAEVGRDAGKA